MKSALNWTLRFEEIDNALLRGRTSLKFEFSGQVYNSIAVHKKYSKTVKWDYFSLLLSDSCSLSQKLKPIYDNS